MIRINKKSEAPEILRTKGETLKNDLIRQADVGEVNFKFSSEVYADKTVKEQLLEDQHRKCAYCEQSKNGDFGCVEHFRPKGGYDTYANNSLVKPGYYWLAYEWDNLLFSCSECNTSCKKNHFPLVDENGRDILHRRISNEEPAIINPAEEDPGNFIEFSEYIVRPKLIDGKENVKGRTTIDIFKLNERNDLKERRKQKWMEYKDLCLFRKVLIKQHIDTSFLDSFILKFYSDDEEFCGMFKYQISNMDYE